MNEKRSDTPRGELTEEFRDSLTRTADWLENLLTEQRAGPGKNYTQPRSIQADVWDNCDDGGESVDGFTFDDGEVEYIVALIRASLAVPSEKTPLMAWGDDVPLLGPDAPKNDGSIKHMIEYLLTVYKRFGNTTITANLQWGASALWKRDEAQKRVAELEAELESARSAALTNTPGGLNRDVSAGTSHSEPDGSATKPAISSSQDGASQGAAPILSHDKQQRPRKELSELLELIRFWRTLPRGSNEYAAADIIERLLRDLEVAHGLERMAYDQRDHAFAASSEVALGEIATDELRYVDIQIDGMWFYLRDRADVDKALAAEWAKHTRNAYLRMARRLDTALSATAPLVDALRAAKFALVNGYVGPTKPELFKAIDDALYPYVSRP